MQVLVWRVGAKPKAPRRNKLGHGDRARSYHARRTDEGDLQGLQGGATTHDRYTAGRMSSYFVAGPKYQRLCTLGIIGLLFALTFWMSWPVVWPALSVALDAGHGGKDPGAVSSSGLQEKTVTLQVARLVQELLIAAGEEALLTRSSDARLESTQRRDLQARVRVAEEAQVDLLVSIHCNAFHMSSVRGPSTFYQPGSVQGQALAIHIQKALIAAMGYGKQEPHADDHLITRVSAMPAVIVELGYLTNPEDERLLTDATYQRRVGQAIVDGILKYAAAQGV